MNLNNLKLVFWGSSNFSVHVLNKLAELKIKPVLIVSTPDKPLGRGLVITQTPVAVWANKNNIPLLCPENIKIIFIDKIKDYSKNSIFLVASYGKIIPKDIIELPEFKTLNIHPSLLPKYRGPSPLQTQILNNESKVGVSIMIVDDAVDHGPIVSQEICNIQNWPVDFFALEKFTAELGATMFEKIIYPWINNEIEAKTQNHELATFTKKIDKIDGEIVLAKEFALKNYLKFLAYSEWPGVYFFVDNLDNKIRVNIKTATFNNGDFIPLSVVPAGKKEMSYSDFLRGLK